MSTSHAGTSKRRTLTGWQAGVIVALIILISLGLAVYAALASYESVSGAATAHHVPLPRWCPLGLDGGLFGVIVVNIVLTWMKIPLAGLRMIARLFAIGTIAANAAAGWPDAVGVGLRVAAPSLFVVLVEAAQAILLRRRRDQGEEEGIPFARWLLDTRSTFRLWRRMRLWEIRDYRQALDMELARLRAIQRLKVLYAGQHGQRWRKAAPQDLVWMLTRGIHMDEALARVAELTAAPEPQVQGEPAGSGRGDQREPVQRGGGSGSGSGQRPGSGRGRRRRGRRPGSGSAPAGDVSTAMEIVTMRAANPDMSNAKIGEAVGVSGSYVGRILKSPPVPGPDQQASQT